jgi:hypothetical protein
MVVRTLIFLGEQIVYGMQPGLGLAGCNAEPAPPRRPRPSCHSQGSVLSKSSPSARRVLDIMKSCFNCWNLPGALLVLMCREEWRRWNECCRASWTTACPTVGGCLVATMGSQSQSLLELCERGFVWWQQWCHSLCYRCANQWGHSLCYVELCETILGKLLKCVGASSDTLFIKMTVLPVEVVVY